MFVKILGCPVHFCIKRKFCGRVLTSFCIVKCIATFSYEMCIKKLMKLVVKKIKDLKTLIRDRKKATKQG